MNKEIGKEAGRVLKKIEEIEKRREEYVTTTIKLEKDVWKLAKKEAIDKGYTLAALIQKALKEYLETLEKEEAEVRKALELAEKVRAEKSQGGDNI